MVRSQLAVRRHWNVSDRCRMVVTTTTTMMQEKRFDAMHRRQDDVRSPDDESCRQILHLGERPSSCEHDTRRDTLVNHRFYRIVFVILILISPSNALPLYPARVPYIQQYPSQPVQPSYSPYAASVQQAPAMLAYPADAQLRRERHRRAMVERMVVLFDEDGSYDHELHSRHLSLSSRRWPIDQG